MSAQACKLVVLMQTAADIHQLARGDASELKKPENATLMSTRQMATLVQLGNATFERLTALQQKMAQQYLEMKDDPIEWKKFNMKYQSTWFKDRMTSADELRGEIKELVQMWEEKITGTLGGSGAPTPAGELPIPRDHMISTQSNDDMVSGNPIATAGNSGTGGIIKQDDSEEPDDNSHSIQVQPFNVVNNFKDPNNTSVENSDFNFGAFSDDGMTQGRGIIGDQTGLGLRSQDKILGSNHVQGGVSLNQCNVLNQVQPNQVSVHSSRVDSLISYTGETGNELVNSRQAENCYSIERPIQPSSHDSSPANPSLGTGSLDGLMLVLQHLSKQEEIREARREKQEEHRLQRDSERDQLLMAMIQSKQETSNASSSGPKLAYPKLKELPFPNFSGEQPHEYAAFWEEFQSSIGTRRDLKDSVKLQYLKQSLQRPAKFIVEGLSISDENYEFACEQLKKKYGCPSKIALALMRRLEELGKKPCGLKASSLTRVYHDHMNILKAMSARSQFDIVHCSMIKRAYPWDKFLDVLYERETRYRAANGECWPAEELMEEIRLMIEVLEDKEYRYVHSDNEEEIVKINYVQHERPLEEKRDTSFRSNEKFPRRNEVGNGYFGKRKCHNCHEIGHPVRECPNIETDDELLRKSRELHLCLKCFSKTHPTAECQRQPCKECKGEHGPLLCQPIAKEAAGKKTQAQNDVTVIQGQVESSESEGAASDSDYEFEIDLSELANVYASIEDQSIKTNKSTRSQLMIFEAAFRSDDSGLEKTVYIFVDSGADRSLITEGLAKEVQANVIAKRNVKWSMVNGHTSEGCSNIVQGCLIGESGFRLPLTLRTIPQCTGTLGYQSLNQEDKDFLIAKKLPVPKELPCAIRPDILLGMDYLSTVIRPDLYYSSLPSGMTVTGSPFGSIISGISEKDREQLDNFSASVHSTLEDAMHKMVDLENIGIGDSPSKEADELLAQQFEEDFLKTVEIRDNKIWVRLPFKRGKELDADNLPIAMSRLMKSQRGAVMKTHGAAYDAMFKQQLEAGIIEEVKDPFGLEKHRASDSKKDSCSDSSPNSSTFRYFSKKTPRTYYIPHSAVFKDSTTTKMRVVYDASASMHGKQSLNDVLNAGPVILPDLFGLMNYSRVFEYIIISDVEKAFHTIFSHEKDRDLTRFLWWKDFNQGPSQDNIVVYRFCRLPFGLSPSPAILGRSIQYSFQQSYPALRHFVDKCLYVDNFVLGTDDVSKIGGLCSLSMEAFANCSMNLREFASNFLPLLKSIPSASIAKEPINCKILGVKWNTETDSFIFPIKMKLGDNLRVTRRNILGITSGNYDPLGLCAPYFVKAKRFGQQLWDGELGWDDEIGQELEKEWNDIAEEVHGLIITIPRKTVYYKDLFQRRFHLACFVDASMIAMCVAMYIRTEYWDGELRDQGHLKSAGDHGVEAEDKFVFAKSCPPLSKSNCSKFFARLQTAKVRLASKDLKEMPRMELVALFMGTNLSEYLVKHFEHKISSVTLFSDSKIVLCQVSRTTSTVLPDPG